MPKPFARIAVVAAFVSALAGVGQVRAQTPQQPQRSQQSAPPKEEPQPPPSSSTTSSVSDLFSIERIRRDLERQPGINLSSAMADPNLPVFRMRIEGYAFKLPTWQQNFVLPQSSVPQPLGGADYYEMQRLITPPQAWGSAPFSNSDLVKMYGLSGAYGLAGVLIKKAIDARSATAAARARAEVQQELAAIEEHNARVAAGAADGDAGTDKAAAKKKQDEEKKKQKEGRKKKGGSEKSSQ